MSSDVCDNSAVIRLPAVLAVGFSGHRTLPDEAASRKRVFDFLAEMKRDAAEILVGVSSVAAGGDLLFAESCIALGIPLRVLLPLSTANFRSDFDSPTWDRAQKVIDCAMSLEVTGKDGRRDEAYYECGLATVLQSQSLLALWDGEAARGLGGTEQIVKFARQIGRPVFWIHSATGDVEVRNEKAWTPHDGVEELKFLNGLGSSGAGVTDQSDEALSTAWLAKLDANAVRVAPQVRRLAALPIVCTSLAAFVSGAASRMHASGVWMITGAVLGLAAGLLPVALRIGKRQALWVRIRTAAEVSRSVRALWSTPDPYELVGPEILPELSGMIVSLNYLKSRGAKTLSVDVDAFKTNYLEERLIDQKSYFKRQSMKAAQKAKRYRLLSKICVVTAVLMSLWTFTGRSLMKTSHAVAGGSWLPLAASALFQVATIAGALLVVNECDRRQRRYREIHDSLAQWEKELRAFHTWSPVMQVVNKIERALLVELLEWRSLLQNTKMPRN